MLDRLLRRFAGHPDADRLAVLHADLRQPLRLLGADAGDVRVDLVFSVATLHWLPDHAEVFRNLAAVLRPGGRLHAEWGGRGNLAAIERVLAELGLPSMQGALTFAGAEETRQHLRAAGFVDADVSLHPDPVRLEPGDQIERFLATVVLGALLDRLPAAERAGIVHAVASRLPQPVIDYVRLRVRATRA
jgi:trans-aconitate 2-methyltransferase